MKASTTALEVLQNGTQISRARAGDPNRLSAILTRELTALMLAFKVKQTFSGPQEIQQLVGDIINDFWYLRVEDVQLCLERAKRGVYGKLYERLDRTIVYEWINNYVANEKDYAVQQAQNRYPKVAPFKSQAEVDAWYAAGIKQTNLTNKLEAERKQKEEEYRRYRAEYLTGPKGPSKPR